MINLFKRAHLLCFPNGFHPGFQPVFIRFSAGSTVFVPRWHWAYPPRVGVCVWQCTPSSGQRPGAELYPCCQRIQTGECEIKARRRTAHPYANSPHTPLPIPMLGMGAALGMRWMPATSGRSGAFFFSHQEISQPSRQRL